MAKKKSLAEAANEIMKGKQVIVENDPEDFEDEEIVDDGSDSDFDVVEDDEDVVEEEEQIDELSKKTLASYAKKASMDKAVSLMQSADGYDKKAAGKRFEKRYKGVNKAIDKLAKEEVEIHEDDMDGLAAKNAASVQPKGKVDALSMAITHIAAMSGDDITKLVATLQQNSAQAAAGVPDDAAAKNAASVAMKTSIKEDLEILFGDNEDLSEEFKENVTTLFEAAVTARVALIESDLQETYEARLNEQLEEIASDLVMKLDEYLNEVASEWLTRNEVAVESALRVEMADNLLGGIRDLFCENNMEVPEDKVDVVEALTAQLEETEAALNEEIEKNLSLNSLIVEFQKETLFAEVATGLTAVDASKFKQLTEDIDYENDEKFMKKLSVIRENYFGRKAIPQKTPSRLISEEIGYEEDDTNTQTFVTPEIAKYSKAISRTIKK